VIATLTEELLTPHHSENDDGPDDDPQNGGPGDSGPDDGGPDEDGPEDGGPAEGGPDPAGPDAEGLNAEGPEAGAAAGVAGGCPEPGRHREQRPGLAFRAGIAVRLDLTTLLGLDQHPGTVPGYGVLASSTARHLARTRSGAATRLLLYDPAGHLEHVLALPPLGARGARRRGRHRKQVVELTAYTATLERLDPAEHLGREATLLRRAHDALAVQRARPPEQHPAVTTAQARRRHPGAELAAWVHARDQTCRFPGCPRPAIRCDLDHTRDWLVGGPTQADDLGPLCEPHHLLKHDPDSGWTLTQPSPGHFVWTSPTGTRHHLRAPRYRPPAGPTPPADAPMSIPDLVFAPPPRRPPPWAPRLNQHGYLTDAARDTAARLTTRTTPTPTPTPQDPPTRYDHDPDF
jgi:hypothetical protein